MTTTEDSWKRRHFSWLGRYCYAARTARYASMGRRGSERKVTKAQILAAVREAKGDKDTNRIAGFKKPDMVEAAEELLADTGWLPQPLRTAPLAEEANEPEFVIVDDGDVTPDGTAVEDDEEAIALRVFVGRAEIGAAWSKRSNENRDYLSLKLDDPSFTQPIYANLFDDTVVEGGDARPTHGLHRQSRPRAPGKGLGRAQPAG